MGFVAFAIRVLSASVRDFVRLFFLGWGSADSSDVAEGWHEESDSSEVGPTQEIAETAFW